MPTPVETYPWHDAAWAALNDCRGRGRLPHALLIDGPAGIGRHAFARRIAAALLCARSEDGSGDACGTCPACRQFAAGSHPDFSHLRLLRKGESIGSDRLKQDATRIRIDQVRELGHALAMSAGHGGWKVALVDPADLMVPAAANALLKTLEEPTPRTLLLLVAARRGDLLPTIRSRCQRLSLNPPSPGEARDWLAARGLGDVESLLAMADGAPLRALELAGEGWVELRGEAFEAFAGVVTGRQDPLRVAASWSAGETETLLAWLGGWLVDMIRLKQSLPREGLDNRDLADRMQALVEHIELSALFTRLDAWRRARRLVTTQVNTQLLCEELLLAWRPSGSS